ncbi:hypothetical protein [Peristeroidobacter soli]|uniref:hypothetical protein n=1 Tax=Peristeroidobacter soli TaxID=2497877 RepID=UPI00101CA6D3|nr:hypothetical protein [Peristeroidobacter soli]
MNGRPRIGNAWSREEIGKLRELAGSGTSLRSMSRILKRSESALKNKAGLHGISLQGSGSKGNRLSETNSKVGAFGL